MFHRAAALADSLTDLFPAWVLGAVALAAVQPNHLSWFHPAYTGQPALTVTLLAVGMQLRLEVGPLAAGFVSRLSRRRRRSRTKRRQNQVQLPFVQPVCMPALPLQDFKRALASPGRILDGVALQYAVMPPLALLIARLGGLSVSYTVGCDHYFQLPLAGAFRAPWIVCAALLATAQAPAPEVTPSSCLAGCAWWRAAQAGALLALSATFPGLMCP